MGQKISARTVAAAKAASRDTFLWDSNLRGFGLKITSSGKKVYVLQYRLGGRGSTTRRYTIGADGSPWSAITARREAERLLLQVKAGVDPRQEKRAAIVESEELRFDKYADKFLELFAREEWAQGTLRNHESNLRRWVVPVLTDKPLSRIDKRDVTAVLDRIPSRSKALRRDVFKLVRRIANWAVERGDIGQSPLVGMKAPSAVPSRDRVLTDREITVILGYSLQGPEWAVWGPFIRLLLLSGQRRSEVAGMDWAELDRGQEHWIIPGSRTKNGRDHRVPLSDIMIHEIDDIAGGSDWPRVGAVLQHKTGTRLSGFSKMKRRLDELMEQSGQGISRDWRLHDLRRTFATGLQKLGIRFEVIAALQNHRSIEANGSTGPYHRHDWQLEKKDAIQYWADNLREIVVLSAEENS